MNTTHPIVGTTVLGYPRIGARRELKTAIEHYWSGRIDATTLNEIAASIKGNTWKELKAAGLDSVPSNTFSYYDQMLDTAVLFDAVPPRYRKLKQSTLDTYFAMARGSGEAAPLELTKWFDTNYHYVVPEISPDTAFRVAGDKPFAEYREAQAAGIITRPVLIGPLTFLLLSKPSPDAPRDFAPMHLLDALVECYAELLGELAAAGVDWVQFDEPAYVCDRSDEELAALHRVYTRLAGLSQRPSIMVATYFGDPGPALSILASTNIEAIAVDLVAAPDLGQRIGDVPGLLKKTVVAGVVDGRNVWRTDIKGAASTLADLRDNVGDLAIGTSCSLLHVPYDLEAEVELEPAVRARLAFARQKVAEVVQLGRPGTSADQLPEPGRTDEVVRDRVAGLTAADRTRAPYHDRLSAQRALGLPQLATTTIGSFPQTAQIRAARADLRAGRIDQPRYQQLMRAEIDRVVALQEDIGLDVLVHGEPERNDMVQYFAELLDGYTATKHGWVQSYGTRCVRPPILHGDVRRPQPMTVEWSEYAQSLTSRPMKGMLTGPVTMLAWSFVRDDQPLAQTADQVALALRDEVADLQRAGIRIIQVDEPALRELLPLRNKDRKEYLDWAVAAFQLATASAAPETQIHTHLCYSEFGDVIEAIDGLDADVTTIEAARSNMEVLADLKAAGFARGIGPGIYDIHSPRIPSTAELSELLQHARAVIPGDRLWVNPDCGLKTRAYSEVEPALRNIVTAAAQAR